MTNEPRDYLGAPIRSLQAMLCVLARTDAALFSVLPDGLYGPETERAVSAFQRRCGLPESGQADNETWNRVVDAFTRRAPLVFPAAPLEIVWQPLQTVAPGERNLHLFPIQAMLLALRRVYPEVPEAHVTGIHDEASVRAVRWLQGVCALKRDGVLTQVEWLYLTKLYSLSVGDGRAAL